MALVVNTNIASLNAQRNLSSSQRTLNTSMQRLSSGLRINSAKDDAAGLAISDRMTSQIRGLNQAARNAQDGISLAQTAEGAMGEITNMLQRMRELTVQGANGTNSPSDVASLQAEYDQLALEITRIAESTTFNGTYILDGAADIVFQVGANAGDENTITVSNSDSLVADGAVAIPPAAGTGLGVEGLDVSDTASLTTIDAAIAVVDSARANYGAVQSRFESTIANVMNTAENLTAARSRILDADIAMETANLTKANVMQQAGTAILAQANQMPMMALSLLQG